MMQDYEEMKQEFERIIDELFQEGNRKHDQYDSTLLTIVLLSRIGRIKLTTTAMMQDYGEMKQEFERIIVELFQEGNRKHDQYDSTLLTILSEQGYEVSDFPDDIFEVIRSYFACGYTCGYQDRTLQIVKRN